MAFVINNPANALVSAQQTGSGNGSALDLRAALGQGYVYVATYAASAIYTIQASYDGTAWLNVSANITGTTTTATAQVSGYFPFMRAQVNSLYSGGGNTGSGVLVWSPLV